MACLLPISLLAEVLQESLFRAEEGFGLILAAILHQRYVILAATPRNRIRSSQTAPSR